VNAALPRPRLLDLLAVPDDKRVALICAPSGFGTSTALRDLSRRSGAPYVAVREGSSLPRFAADLVEALAGVVPGMQMTLTAAYERALDAQDPTAALAAWFARHSAGRRFTVVLDHLHAAGSPEITRFIVDIVERSAPGGRWIIASQSLDDLPVASWLAHGLANVPRDASDLRLDETEAAAFAGALAPGTDAGSVAALLAATGGCVADFVYFLRTPEALAANAGVPDAGADMRSRFAALSRSERTLAVRSALLPSLDDAALASLRIPGYARTLAGLRARARGLFADDGSRWDPRFRRFLRDRLDEWSEPRRAAVAARTAAALERSGDLAGALDLYARFRLEREILRVAESHAFRPLESGAASLLHDALAAVDIGAQKTNPAVLTLRALSASLRGRTDVAEVLFQHALSNSRNPAQTISVRYLYAKDLLRRGRLDAIALLQPDETFLAAPDDVRVASMASLGVAYALDGQPELAEKWVARALRDAARLRDGAVRARVYQQVAYVAVEAGDCDRATRFARRAAALAEAAGEFEVAASAYSVLYVVASDFDDDPAKAASYLSRIAAFGAKSGSIDKQLMAWVAAYEIEAERGDLAAVAAIERELGEFDLHYSARIPSEGLLPAQVLKATWAGDFSRAFHTLNPSAGLLATPDREALRWAEIAVYAAAAGEHKAATAAILAALRCLKRTSTHDLRTLRARLYCALAFVLLGRLAAPRMILEAARRELPPGRPRVTALYEAVAQLARFRAGDGNHRELADALDGLRAHDLGGIARMLEALPARLLRDAGNRARSA
jgi:hypothetical protein